MIAPPLGLYIHFPWCVSKCPYCDFNSHALKGEVPEERYLEALRLDLESQLDPAGPLLDGSASPVDRSVTSIFLGGGTPSLFSPDAIGRVLGQVRHLLPVAADAEVTLEANPGTIERGRFAGYAAAGVNRVSLGAQSFDADVLKRLGRIHSPAETCAAAEELHAAGIANFNLDLMYALPGQDRAGALRDVEAALALRPAQVSHYHLTMEPGTPFAALPPPGLPADEQADDMLEACQQRLGAAGYERYEISAYARPGRACAHNLNYWRFGDYLGIGAGAHGKLSVPRPDGLGWEVRRSLRLREPRRYLGSVPGGLTVSAVDPAQLPFEFMLNALRLIEGADRALFESRTGLAWEGVEARVAALVRRGLLEMADPGPSFRPSVRGLAFLNDLLVEFLPEESGT
jgi:oxygen-independent coproporphyrinogen-3 oxidase